MTERPGRSGTSARWPAAVLVLAGLGALSLLAADETTETRSPPAGEVAGVQAIDRGIRYCPVTAGEGETATLVLATGAEASEATVVRYDDAGPQADEPLELDAAERLEVPLDDEEARRPVAVEWSGGSLAVSWHVDGERDAGAPCPTAPAGTWHLPGLDTALGADARLHLFNPFSVDAVVRVRFGTPEGRVDLVRTDNVLVPAGGTEVLDLVEVQPEETELGVTVETVAGRVVAGGEVDRTRLDDDEEEGPQGRTVIPAAEPAREWHIPSAITDEGWASDVVVYNPGERETAVAVRTSDPLDDVARGEHPVPAGGTTRISLTDRAETSVFAVVVETVTDVPVVAAQAESFLDPERPGYTVQAGVPSPAPTWVVPAGPGDRAEQVAVHNPGSDPVEVDVTVGGEPVEQWRARVLAANERDAVMLDDLDDRAGPVVVEADGDVSAALVSNLADGDDFARLLGLAFDFSEEDTGEEPVRVRHDRSLATQPIRPTDPALDDEVGEDLRLPGLGSEADESP